MAETLIFSTGSRIISGTLTSTASISQLNLDGVSGSFTGSFIGDGSEVTGIVSASHAAQADSVTSASHALQADNAKTADSSTTSSFAETASLLLGSIESATFAATASLLLGSIESASFATFAQTAGSAASASDVAYDDVRDKPTLVSSSVQITGPLGAGGVTGSFTGTFEGDFPSTGLISSSAQFDGNDSFDMDNLVVSGAINVLGNATFRGSMLDVISDVEVADGFGMRIGHSAFIQGPDPADPLAQSSSLQELQVIGGNDGPDSMQMIVRFSNTGSNGPFLILGRSRGNGIGSYSRPFSGDELGGVLWSITDGFSSTFRVHAASIKARVDGFTAQAGLVGAELVFSVAGNVSANDITEAMRIRKNTTLDIFGSEIISGTLLVLGTSSLGQTVLDGASGSFTGTFIGDFTGSTSFTGSFTGGLEGTASVAQSVVGGGGGSDTSFTYFDVDAPVEPTNSFNDEFNNSGSLDSKWVESNSGNVTASLAGDGLLRIETPATLFNQDIFLQPIPSGTWVCRMKIAYQSFTTAAQQFIGFALQNQNNDRLEVFQFVHDTSQPGRWLIEYTNPTTFSSTDNINSMTQVTWREIAKNWFYLEVEFDGVNIDYRYSYDGIGFDDAFVGLSRTTGSWLNGPLTHIGLAFANGENPLSCSVDWIRIGSGSRDINGGLRTIGTG